MNLRIATLAAAALVALTGCATQSFERYAEAANKLDPGCKKSVHIEVRPLLIFGWPVPLVSGTFDKECPGEGSPARP